MHTFDESYFDAGLDRRGTRCEKWDGTEKESVLPLWVADMDFPSPPEVAEAIAVRALHPTYGYTLVLPDDTRALTGFWQRRHNLTIQDEWVMMIPCVVTGIRLALLALTKPGDGVMIQSPVYGPFRFSVEATERRLMDAPLKRDDTGRYSMDLDAVEKQLQAGAKALVLCNPHNPVSRAWKREELQALIDLLARYGAYLIADEIHADFVYAPEQFVPVLSRAAVAVGIAGLFMETHPDPAQAMSDGPNAVPLKHMRALLEQLVALDQVVKSRPLLENSFDC